MEVLSQCATIGMFCKNIERAVKLVKTEHANYIPRFLLQHSVYSELLFVIGIFPLTIGVTFQRKDILISPISLMRRDCQENSTKL